MYVWISCLYIYVLYLPVMFFYLIVLPSDISSNLFIYLHIYFYLSSCLLVHLKISLSIFISSYISSCPLVYFLSSYPSFSLPALLIFPHSIQSIFLPAPHIFWMCLSPKQENLFTKLLKTFTYLHRYDATRLKKWKLVNKWWKFL